MMILAPVCKHKDTGEPCNYASWRSRGWCRMELMSAKLAPRKIPTLVCAGAEADPFFVHSFDVPRLSQQTAKFSCCDLGHVLNGCRLPCDKVRVAALMETMLQAKVMQLRTAGRSRKPELHFYNSARHIFTRGLNGAGDVPPQAAIGDSKELACRDSRVAAAAKARQQILRTLGPGVQRLKALLGWTEEDEAEGHRTGFTLVLCAAMADDTEALREMLASADSPHVKDVNLGVKRNHPDLAYMWKGSAPLNAAMIFGCWETCEVLLEAGANPKQRLSNGMDCLFGAVCIGNKRTTKKFLERFPTWDVNRIDKQFQSNTLVVAAVSLAQKQHILKCLLDAGGDMFYTGQWGSTHTLLCAACNNEDSDVESVKFLVEQGADVHGKWQPHDLKWRLLEKTAHFLAPRISVRLIKELAMMDGATPLHFAAKRGTSPS